MTLRAAPVRHRRPIESLVLILPIIIIIMIAIVAIVVVIVILIRQCVCVEAPVIHDARQTVAGRGRR